MNLRCIFRNLSNIYAGFLNEKKLLTFITKKLYRTGFNSSKDTSIFYRITVPKGFVKLKRKKVTHMQTSRQFVFWKKFFETNSFENVPRKPSTLQVRDGAEKLV